MTKVFIEIFSGISVLGSELFTNLDIISSIVRLEAERSFFAIDLYAPVIWFLFNLLNQREFRSLIIVPMHSVEENTVIEK